MGVFVIAEAATTWRYGDELATARRSIKAAKDCGADAWKTQWTSNGDEMARRRGMSRFGQYDRLAWPKEWHPRLKAMCDEAGIEYMCTVYLPQDIEVIAPLVNRFKVSAFESRDEEFCKAHWTYEKPIVISVNPGRTAYHQHLMHSTILHCISQYPCPLENLHLRPDGENISGLSDHTTSTLTGAVAVGCGARIIEKHIRLWGTTSKGDPDYSHSLDCDFIPAEGENEICEFRQYVQNIREAERML